MIHHPAPVEAPDVPTLYVYVGRHAHNQGMVGVLNRRPGWETYSFTDARGGVVIQCDPEDVRPLAYGDRIASPPPFAAGDRLNYKHPDFDLTPIPVTFVKDDEGWAEITSADGGVVTTRYSRLTRR